MLVTGNSSRHLSRERSLILPPSLDFCGRSDCHMLRSRDESQRIVDVDQLCREVREEILKQVQTIDNWNSVEVSIFCADSGALPALQSDMLAAVEREAKDVIRNRHGRRDDAWKLRLNGKVARNEGEAKKRFSVEVMMTVDPISPMRKQRQRQSE